MNSDELKELSINYWHESDEEGPDEVPNAYQAGFRKALELMRHTAMAKSNNEFNLNVSDLLDPYRELLPEIV